MLPSIMESTPSIQFVHLNGNRVMHGIDTNMNAMAAPLEKLNKAQNIAEANLKLKSEFLEPPLVDAQIALQNGSACQEVEHHKRMQDVVLAPYKYLQSLPSKGVRNVLIDALNIWFKVPEDSHDIITDVIALLHNSSLMFDDIEDGSTLRRGKPTAHTIFGVSQTINSSTYVLMSSIGRARSLSNNDCVNIVIDGVSLMLEGQGMDLHSTYLTECPRESEYLQMVDRKTGGLFQIVYQLMRAESLETTVPSLHDFIIMLGRYFQIRDDYMNLMSDEYTGQKGFCEDLDEGKFSFPIIHCLGGIAEPGPDTSYALELKNMMMLPSRGGENCLPTEVKCHMLKVLHCAGSLDFTKIVLEQLEKDIWAEIDRVEKVSGVSNPVLRSLMGKMKI